MGVQIQTEKVLKYDNQTNSMVTRIEVTAQLLGRNGTVMAEAGPLYAETGKDVWELGQILRRRLIRGLPGMEDAEV